MSLLRRLLAWIFRNSPSVSTAEDGRVEHDVARPDSRLHVPRSVMRAMRSATRPTVLIPEPLVLLRVRFASELQRDTVVVVGAMSFPDDAYVEGFAGANFDTTWVINAANAAIKRNQGLFLVHSHGGLGVPRFSGVDERTNRDIMAMLANGITTAPYGAMVLSQNSATAVVARNAGLSDLRVIEVPDAFGEFEMAL